MEGISRCLRVFLLTFCLARAGAVAADTLPTLDEALASKEDVWGLAAMREPNGPSYEFFEKLLPPLRYVNAAFRYYPIILSAPGSAQKVRLLSTGGAINPHAELKTWKEKGVPVTFFVGEKQIPFGADLRNVSGPHYMEGWLPVVQIGFTNAGVVYTEEAFASVDPAQTNHGVAFVKFKASGRHGQVTVKLDPSTHLFESGNALIAVRGLVHLYFDNAWKWVDSQHALISHPTESRPATLAIFSVPQSLEFTKPISYSLRYYEKQKSRCVLEWKEFLQRGMNLEVPEPVVNNAWRALTVGDEVMVKGDSANYSWGNAYERLYEAECGDMARAFLLYGFAADTHRMLPPLLDYTNDKLQFHNAGFKLQMLAHYYWLTRDADFIRSTKERWQKYVTLITDGREADSGLGPREAYCGDIFTAIYSLNSNAAGWRGLRDIAAVLADMGEIATAQQLTTVAAEYRKKILAAVDKSERTDVKPPFIPIALFGEEKPYDVLTSSMLAGYWDLLAPYVINSGIFGPGSPRERVMLDYLQEHGGICMGMIRFDQHSGLFANMNAVDDLYGLRYVNKLLELDEPDRALVSFYGKLAQGMTRDTFIGAEGTGLKPLDEFGRPMYLPPNSAANAHFLWTLRYLLVQDWDADDDGKPDTMRLLFATPKRWLEDGKIIRLERAPTAFGEISLNVKSRLKHGEIIAEITLPRRETPKHTWLRIRVPDGWKIVSATLKSGALPHSTPVNVDAKGTIELPPVTGKLTARFTVAENRR